MIDYEPQRPRPTWDFTWFVIAACVCLGILLIGMGMFTFRALQQPPAPTTAPTTAPATPIGRQPR